MPPKIFFLGKKRPLGGETPACAPCNNLAGISDQVVGWLTRAYPDDPSPAAIAESRKLLQGIVNNAPGLLQQLSPPRALARRLQREFGLSDDHGFLDWGGPAVAAHLDAFAARFALAMYYREFGMPLPASGGVVFSVFSNLDALAGRVPSVLFDMHPEPVTLQQGRWEVRDQYLYSSNKTPEGQASAYAIFRKSMMVWALASPSMDILEFAEGYGARIVRPGQFNVLRPRIWSASIYFRAELPVDAD